MVRETSDFWKGMKNGILFSVPLWILILFGLAQYSTGTSAAEERPKASSVAAGEIVQPDPDLTPGRTVSVELSRLCRPYYTRDERHVTPSTKRRVCELYGKKDQCPKGYEIDHLISLELGGSNEIENLWPQPIRQARQKDVVETWLHRQVCAYRMTLQTAQEVMKGDLWFDTYRKLKTESVTVKRGKR